jgi:hypothetical protein
MKGILLIAFIGIVLLSEKKKNENVDILKTPEKKKVSFIDYDDLSAVVGIGATSAVYLAAYQKAYNDRFGLKKYASIGPDEYNRYGNKRYLNDYNSKMDNGEFSEFLQDYGIPKYTG